MMRRRSASLAHGAWNLMRVCFAPLTLLAVAGCTSVSRSADLSEASAPTAVPIDTSSCVAALDSLQSVVRRDYAGYRDKVRGREVALAALTDSVRAVAQRSDHYSVCIAQGLGRWVRFFRDPHLMVWQAAPPFPTELSPQAAQPVRTAADDPLRPSLRFVDDSTAVLRLPSFEPEYKPVIDSLVAANRGRLLVAPYLIVDVRENGGGWTGSYTSLRPLLYTGPVHVPGMEAWASEGNIAFFRTWLSDEHLSEELKAQVRAVLPRMEANPNSFVVLAQDTVIRLDRVHPMPREVAVLMDNGCFSSCEDFLLEARQSQKVALLGAESTTGGLEYGNVKKVWLPGWRRLLLPTSRWRGLAENPTDNIGIAPEVQIPEGELDAVEFARRFLRSGL